MKAEHLLEDEIEWELRFKRIGFNETDKLGDKQRIYRTSLRAVVKGAPEIEGRLWMGLNVDEEFKTVGTKVETIGIELKTKGSKSKDFHTFESRLLHFKRRVEALLKEVTNPELLEEGSRIKNQIQELCLQFFPNPELVEKPYESSEMSEGAQGDAEYNLGNILERLDKIGNNNQKDGQDVLKGAVKKTVHKTNVGGAYRFPEDIDKQNSDNGFKSTAENSKSDLGWKSRIPDRVAKEKKSTESTEKESKLKALQKTLDKRLAHLEENEDSSAEELDTLIELQQAMKLRIEMLRLKGKEPRKYKIEDLHSVEDKEVVRNSSRSRQRIRQSSNSSDESNSPSDNRHSDRQRRRHRRNSSPGLPVSRWGIKFSGDDDVTVMDFLRQVDIWKKSEKMSGSKLLSKAHQLLKGSAWTWYTSAADRFENWGDFVNGLKEAFTPEDFDFILLQECQKRQQLRSETFEIYLARMNQLFDGLSYNLSNQTKLSILKQNLKASHKVGIAMLDIQTIEGLRKYCRRLDSLDPSLYVKQSPHSTKHHSNKAQIFEIEETKEDSKKDTKKKEKTQKEKRSSRSKTESKTSEDNEICNVEQARPQNRQNYQKQGRNQKNFQPQNKNFSNKRGNNNNLGGSNYAYYMPMPMVQSNQAFLENWAANITGQTTQNKTGGSNGFPSPNAPTFVPSTQITRVNPTNQQNQLICWNCDGTNHHQRFCMAPRRVFCFGCGRKDVYLDSCPNCSGNGTQRLSAGAKQSQ